MLNWTTVRSSSLSSAPASEHSEPQGQNPNLSLRSYTARDSRAGGAARAVLAAAPGGELPGRGGRAPPLLLRDAAVLLHQRAGEGEAGGVQLGGGPGRPARLLQPAAAHRPGGEGRRWDVGASHGTAFVFHVFFHFYSRGMVGAVGIGKVWEIEGSKLPRAGIEPGSLRSGLLCRKSKKGTKVFQPIQARC